MKAILLSIILASCVTVPPSATLKVTSLARYGDITVYQTIEYVPHKLCELPVGAQAIRSVGTGPLHLVVRGADGQQLTILPIHVQDGDTIYLNVTQVLDNSSILVKRGHQSG